MTRPHGWALGPNGGDLPEFSLFGAKDARWGAPVFLQLCVYGRRLGVTHKSDQAPSWNTPPIKIQGFKPDLGFLRRSLSKAKVPPFPWTTPPRTTVHPNAGWCWGGLHPARSTWSPRPRMPSPCCRSWAGWNGRGWNPKGGGFLSLRLSWDTGCGEAFSRKNGHAMTKGSLCMLFRGPRNSTLACKRLQPVSAH